MILESKSINQGTYLDDIVFPPESMLGCCIMDFCLSICLLLKFIHICFDFCGILCFLLTLNKTQFNVYNQNLAKLDFVTLPNLT